MGWGSVLGKVALDTASDLLFKRDIPRASSSEPTASESVKPSKKPVETSPSMRKERAMFDEFIKLNAQRSLEDCSDELLDLINKFVEKAYYTGGEEMREGLMEELRRNGY